VTKYDGIFQYGGPPDQHLLAPVSTSRVPGAGRGPVVRAKATRWHAHDKRLQETLREIWLKSLPDDCKGSIAISKSANKPLEPEIYK
jgi:hypothetical protein